MSSPQHRDLNPAPVQATNPAVDTVAASTQSATDIPLAPSLRDQHYTIRFGDSGHSYLSIVADYLSGATKVRVEDPYIRISHQHSASHRLRRPHPEGRSRG